MRKLSLIRSVKEELKKDELQKVQAGLEGCACGCACYPSTVSSSNHSQSRGEGIRDKGGEPDLPE
jgi:hypothetical protein